MSSQKSGIALAKNAYSNTFQSFKNNPAVFIPFIIFAALEAIGLIFIYFAPRMPLKLIFGPPIRTLWDEKFLHYPANFLLMPKLISLSRMGLSIIAGSLLTGIAVALVFELYNKRKIRLEASLKLVSKKYIYLFLAVLIYTVLFYIASKAITIGLSKYFIAGHAKLLFLNARAWLGPILICFSFIIAILIQAAFIYVIPILIIENKKLTKAIAGSFALFKKLFIPTIILVGLPMLIYIPIIVLNGNTVLLITKLFPEIIVFVSFLGIIVNSLVIDPIVTISATFLYLKNQGK